MPWDWDERKNKRNQRKHGLSFETAELVFADPLAVSRCDEHPDEQRWQTVGRVGDVVVMVVHTSAEFDLEAGNERGRIISARKATKHERRIYEEGDF